MAKRRKMSFLSSFARKESTHLTHYRSQELAGTKERACTGSSRNRLCPTLQAAQVENKRESETEYPCAPSTGTLHLGGGRIQLGGMPVCTREGSFARSPLLERPETSNLGAVAEFPATSSVPGIAGFGLTQCNNVREYWLTAPESTQKPFGLRNQNHFEGCKC